MKHEIYETLLLDIMEGFIWFDVDNDVNLSTTQQS